MSVLFGRWNFNGAPIDGDYLETVSSMIAPYGPDNSRSYDGPAIHIHYRALHTTEESHRELQPYATPSGSIISWDGRLDNRKELISQLEDAATNRSTDAAIVAAAYERWGTKSFAKIAGDWALSIWEAKTRSLMLAKDPLGTRPLYYWWAEHGVCWSSILDPLVTAARGALGLCEEYLAGWLSSSPAPHLTPYVGIHSVPPSCFVLLGLKTCRTEKYWDFDPAVRIRYRSDAEYEEHFRAVFAEAVGRRLRADRSILAELSGGMDSSSIVCMADALIERGAIEAPRLDTVSYFDDCEPNWNERPFFTKVEEKRRRAGCHIDVGSQEALPFEPEWERFALTPVPFGVSPGVMKRLREWMASQGHRVLLSGTAGDEVAGGVPTPIPELEDLLARGHFGILARQLKIWALHKRTPWFHLLLEATRRFFPPTIRDVPPYRQPPPWVRRSFVGRNRAALRGYDRAIDLWGPLPSFQENIAVLDGLRRQVARSTLSATLPCEKRYPYLDRDLLAFLFAIPREQLVRPGQRRSLMRRALAGVVPDEILSRKRKAFLSRSPVRKIAARCSDALAMGDLLAAAASDIFDRGALERAIERASCGGEVQASALTRTFEILRWTRGLRSHGMLSPGSEAAPQASLGKKRSMARNRSAEESSASQH